MLQVLINQVLKLNPDLDRFLVVLQGKCVAIICTDFPSHSIYCTFDNSQVLLTSSAPENIAVEISSSLRGLLKFAISRQHDAIKITGDATVAELVQKLYLELNIDWEEELSKFTGDAIAHQALFIIKQLKLYQTNTSDSVAQMVTEYLQQEAELLPTHFEVEEFNHSVDELRLRVDRLEARIKAYESD